MDSASCSQAATSSSDIVTTSASSTIQDPLVASVAATIASPIGSAQFTRLPGTLELTPTASASSTSFSQGGSTVTRSAAAIGVGTSVPLLLIAAGILVLLKRKRNKQGRSVDHQKRRDRSTKNKRFGQKLRELDGTQVPEKLDPTVAKVELPIQ